MFASERFRRRMNRVRKDFRQAEKEEIRREIAHAFDLVLSHLPEDLRIDLFDYLMERYPERTGTYADLFDYAEYLGDVIDLLNLEYDEQADPLFREDWDYIRDSVSDFALELDMDLVNYVMQLVVAKGFLG
jgi:hypothetical protein